MSFSIKTRYTCRRTILKVVKQFNLNQECWSQYHCCSKKGPFPGPTCTGEGCGFPRQVLSYETKTQPSQFGWEIGEAQNVKRTEARNPTQTHCMWTTLSHVPGSQTPGGWSSQSEPLVSGEPSEEPWWSLWDNASKVFSHTTTATRIANFATFLQCERGQQRSGSCEWSHNIVKRLQFPISSPSSNAQCALVVAMKKGIIFITTILQFNCPYFPLDQTNWDNYKLNGITTIRF